MAIEREERKQAVAELDEYPAAWPDERSHIFKDHIVVFDVRHDPHRHQGVKTAALKGARIGNRVLDICLKDVVRIHAAVAHAVPRALDHFGREIDTPDLEARGAQRSERSTLADADCYDALDTVRNERVQQKLQPEII